MSLELNVWKITFLQYRADRLHRSIRSIAEDSKSANHDLESRLQYLEGSFHAIHMLPKDDRIKDLEKQIDEQLEHGIFYD